MQFTLKSEYVAMAVARDLAWSALESPNIKGVFLMQRQWKLRGMSNCLRESFFYVPFNYHASLYLKYQN